MNYASIIFDIVGSRRYEDRYGVQEIIKQSIDYLNEMYKSSIIKEVVFGAGDEFQGLFTSISAAYAYARELQILIYPIKIRAGIGFGSIKYFVEGWKSTEIDGESYYKARDAIDAIPNGVCSIFINSKMESDRLLNTISIMNSKTRFISPMGRLLEIILEFFFPLYKDRKKPDLKEFMFISFIISNYYNNYIKFSKYGLSSIENSRLKNERFSCRSDEILNTNPYELKELFEYFYSKNDIYQSGLYYENTVPFGTQALLEKIVGTSKQNINRHFNSGVKDARNAAVAILYYLIGFEHGGK